jgi:DNA-binding XRE family transcriptional regulator
LVVWYEWIEAIGSFLSESRGGVGGSALVLALEPAEELASLEQPSAFDLVRGELSAGGEPVDLLRLATEDAGDLLDGQESRQRSLGTHDSCGTISAASDGTRPVRRIDCHFVRAGEVIREARLLVGLSQEGLAERIGVPRQSIARWERGEVEPGFDNVRRLLRSCGFDVSLVRYQADESAEDRLGSRLELTPQERLVAMLGDPGNGP